LFLFRIGFFNSGFENCRIFVSLKQSNRKKKFKKQNKKILRTMKKLILSVFALAAITLSANAQTYDSHSAVGNASATLKKSLKIENVTSGQTNSGNLAFGQISITEAAATVVILPTVAAVVNTAMTATPTNCTLLSTDQTAAAFKITGIKNSLYTLTIPTATLTSSTGGHTITISDWNSSLTGNALSDNFGSSTEKTFLIGGQLNIPTNAYQGAYTGTFNVQVAYN
jgi:hypothetical protein